VTLARTPPPHVTWQFSFYRNSFLKKVWVKKCHHIPLFKLSFLIAADSRELMLKAIQIIRHTFFTFLTPFDILF
jgi:hypothetical protein